MKYYGKYRAIVADNKDEEQHGRVRCTVPAVLGEELLTDWAWAMFPVDGYTVPEIGTPVFVEFEAGNIDRPMYMGAWYAKGDDAWTAHPRTFGEDVEEMSGVKGTDTIRYPEGGEAVEPKNPYAGEYPKVRTHKLPGGIVVEVDSSSEDGPRLHLFHPSGSFWEVHPDGSLVKKVTQEYSVCKGDKSEHIQGDNNVQIDGTMRVVVSGDVYEDTLGNVQSKINGDRVLEITGKFEIQAKKITLNGGGGQIGGVVTDKCVCAFTGAPHSEGSKSVFASK